MLERAAGMAEIDGVRRQKNRSRVDAFAESPAYGFDGVRATIEPPQALDLPTPVVRRGQACEHSVDRAGQVAMSSTN